MIMAECHPDRQNVGRKMCKVCYRKWYKENKGKVLRKPARIPDCHPDRFHHAKGLCQKCYTEQWQKNNPEKMEKYRKTQRESSPFGFYFHDPLWAKKNPEKVKASAKKRRKLIADSPLNASPGERKRRAELFNNQCAYCGEDYKHMDHLIPLSKGGDDSEENMVPACARCNFSKHTRLWHVWYREQPFYDIERERLIEKNTISLIT